jgi:lipopolysaccharide heptosyltransferase II
MNRESLKILVIRPDYIGDVILSTPVFEAIKKQYPQAHLTILVQELVAPLVQGLSSVDHCMIFDPKGRHAGFRGFFQLLKEIYKERFEMAVVLQSHWKIGASLFFAGISCRIGPWSKLHSFLFYNFGIRQRRSRVQMHEADYNLELLKRLKIDIKSRSVLTQVSISQEIQEEARIWLQKKGWDPQRKLVVIHPGMRGSALNWPQSHYQDLVIELLKDHMQVLVSGGPGDCVLLEDIRKKVEQKPLLPTPLFYFGNYPIDFLGGLFSFSDLVVVAGTGPLHLAVALGRAVVTFQSPILVQNSVRWGPYVKEKARAGILTPQVYCGQVFRCLGSRCSDYPCMESLTVTQALTVIKEHLGEVGKPPKTDRSRLYL